MYIFYMKFGSPQKGGSDIIKDDRSSRSASPGRNVGSFIPRCSLSNQVLSTTRIAAWASCMDMKGMVGVFNCFVFKDDEMK